MLFVLDDPLHAQEVLSRDVIRKHPSAERGGADARNALLIHTARALQAKVRMPANVDGPHKLQSRLASR